MLNAILMFCGDPLVFIRCWINMIGWQRSKLDYHMLEFVITLCAYLLEFILSPCVYLLEFFLGQCAFLLEVNLCLCSFLLEFFLGLCADIGSKLTWGNMSNQIVYSIELSITNDSFLSLSSLSLHVTQPSRSRATARAAPNTSRAPSFRF